MRCGGDDRFETDVLESSSNMTTPERRKAARASAKLAMEIRVSGQDCGRAETINVSANGVYFSSKAYIAPLTRLEIVLVLPEEPDGAQSMKSGKRATAVKREVTCEGVVVRTVQGPGTEDGSDYQVACYFTSISRADREHLESYILNQLPF